MTTELEPQERKRLWFELGLVAALSLGQASVYAIVRLADIATRGPISEAQAKLNTSLSPRPGFDLVYQLLDIAFTLVPVALALYLLTRDHDSRRLSTRLGTDGHRVRDLGHGPPIFVIIGRRQGTGDHRRGSADQPRRPLVDHTGAHPLGREERNPRRDPHLRLRCPAAAAARARALDDHHLLGDLPRQLSPLPGHRPVHRQ